MSKAPLCNRCYLRMMVYFVMYWQEINATENLLFLYRYVVFLYLSSFSMWSSCTVLYCHLSPFISPFSFLACPLSSMLKLKFITAKARNSGFGILENKFVVGIVFMQAEILSAFLWCLVCYSWKDIGHVLLHMWLERICGSEWQKLVFSFLRQKLNTVTVKQMAVLPHNKYLKKIKLYPACLLTTVPAPIVTAVIIIGGFTVHLFIILKVRYLGRSDKEGFFNVGKIKWCAWGHPARQRISWKSM